MFGFFTEYTEKKGIRGRKAKEWHIGGDYKRKMIPDELDLDSGAQY